MSERETRPLPDHEILNFVGRDWEFFSIYADVPRQRGKITRVAIKPIQFLLELPDGSIVGDGRVEDWIQVFVPKYVRYSPEGTTIEQAKLDNEGNERPFFAMQKNEFLNAMKSQGNRYVMESPDGSVTNIIQAPGDNINLP